MLAFLPLSLRILGGRGKPSHMEKAPAQGMLGHSVEKTEVRPITYRSRIGPAGSRENQHGSAGAS